MKKLIILVMVMAIFPLVLFSQVDTTKQLPKNNTTGYMFKNIGGDSSVRFPLDTFKLKQFWNGISFKNNLPYYFDWSVMHWRPISTGSAQTMQNVFDLQNARAILNKNDTLDMGVGFNQFTFFKSNDSYVNINLFDNSGLFKVVGRSLSEQPIYSEGFDYGWVRNEIHNSFDSAIFAHGYGSAGVGLFLTNKFGGFGQLFVGYPRNTFIDDGFAIGGTGVGGLRMFAAGSGAPMMFAQNSNGSHEYARFTQTDSFKLNVPAFYTSNLHGRLQGHALIDRDYVDSLFSSVGGGSQTLQNVFDIEAGNAVMTHGATNIIDLNEGILNLSNGSFISELGDGVNELETHLSSTPADNARMGTDLNLSIPFIYLSTQRSGATLQSNFNIRPDSTVFESIGNGHGIQYKSNYGSTFVPLSLVDKNYVDSVLAAASGVAQKFGKDDVLAGEDRIMDMNTSHAFQVNNAASLQMQVHSGGTLSMSISSNTFSFGSSSLSMDGSSIGLSNHTVLANNAQLALGWKTTSGDPTAISNGSMYYNSNSNKFRVRENGSWKDMISTSTTNWANADQTLTANRSHSTGGFNLVVNNTLNGFEALSNTSKETYITDGSFAKSTDVQQTKDNFIAQSATSGTTRYSYLKTDVLFAEFYASSPGGNSSIHIDSSLIQLNGNISAVSHKITNVTNPTSAQDAATKNYVDNIAAAINPAIAVEASTTANVSGYTYSNGVGGIGATLTQNSASVVVIDGYTLLLNDRVLFKNQTTGANNGVYLITTLGTGIIPAVFTRALDYDQSSNINNTGTVPVINGTVNASTSWLLTSLVTTVGADALTYTQFTYNPSTLITTSTTAGGDLSGTYPNPSVIKINGTSLSGLATGILKNTTSTGVPSIAVAGDFPTLNQNTTGSAAKWTTPRNIQGVSIDGTANIDIINGTGFVKATGTTISYDNSTYLTTSSAASTYQPLDADLTTISGLTATTDNFMVGVSSAWASRTPAQVRTTLGLVIGTNVQAFNAHLLAIAGLTATNDDILQYKAGEWTNRTMAQLKTDLVLVKGDVGLGNVDNTSDATKNAASVALTNKTITAPVISSIVNTGTMTVPTVTGTLIQYVEGSTASSSTPGGTGDARENYYDITALSAAPTFAAPSGTPSNHNTLLYRIKDNGTARAITWNAIYRGGTGIALPTTTTISKTMYVQFVYNSTDSKWDLTGVTDGL